MTAAYRLGANQRIDVEGQEQAVEQVVGQDVVEEFTVDDEDVVQVVQVVEVLGHQVAELPSVLVSGSRQRKRERRMKVLEVMLFLDVIFMKTHFSKGLVTSCNVIQWGKFGLKP